MVPTIVARFERRSLSLAQNPKSAGKGLVVILPDCELHELWLSQHTNLNVSTCVHEYIVTLDVSVDDASGVKMVEPFAGLKELAYIYME